MANNQEVAVHKESIDEVISRLEFEVLGLLDFALNRVSSSDSICANNKNEKKVLH